MRPKVTINLNRSARIEDVIVEGKARVEIVLKDEDGDWWNVIEPSRGEQRKHTIDPTKFMSRKPEGADDGPATG